MTGFKQDDAQADATQYQPQGQGGEEQKTGQPFEEWSAPRGLAFTGFFCSA